MQYTVALIHTLGYPISITMDAGEGERLDDLLQRLQAQGYRPPWQPWPTAPSGEPLCLKHQAVMAAREKQGDSWYSHRVVTAHGDELYCRGYAFGPRDRDGFMY